LASCGIVILTDDMDFVVRDKMEKLRTNGFMAGCSLFYPLLRSSVFDYREISSVSVSLYTEIVTERYYSCLIKK